MEVSLEIIQKFLKEKELELKPSQERVCFPILERIIDKIQRGAKFSPIQVENDVIVNGHHRYICYSLLNLEIERINWRQSQKKVPDGWAVVAVEIEDWDEPEDVEKYEKAFFPLADNVKSVIE